MRIAFYAPLKPPDHPVASGDRAMARALIAALERSTHEVTLAAHFRSYDSGDARRQVRLREEGRKIAHRYLRKIARGGEPPEVWFTYHLYHKAPDWLGPVVAERLGIPYVVAEASYAPKQAGGQWDLGHRAVADAIRQAALVLQPNPADAECVLPLLDAPQKMLTLRPFIDTAPFRAPDRGASRAAIGSKFGLDEARPWLCVAAMMRDDQKLLSYRVLADALSRVADRPWQLVVAGAGPAEEIVRELFAPFGERVRWAGVLEPDAIKQLYRAADLYLWPAVKEAFGVALIEAQAAGLPVVAGRSGGVSSVISDGDTGLLVPEGDAASFASAVADLLDDPDRRFAMGRKAMDRAAHELDIAGAAALLDDRLRKLVNPA
jgi:glycosyltransferase involved in cell wall biosynthesis